MRGIEDTPVTEQADRQHLYSSGIGLIIRSGHSRHLGFARCDQFQVCKVVCCTLVRAKSCHFYASLLLDVLSSVRRRHHTRLYYRHGLCRDSEPD